MHEIGRNLAHPWHRSPVVACGIQNHFRGTALHLSGARVLQKRPFSLSVVQPTLLVLKIVSLSGWLWLLLLLRSFPVESMVIRPEDGKVLSHINANKLLDTSASSVLESIM